jgi:hypothetical protein
MVLFALAAVALIALVGLALDGGLAYFSRTGLQSAADTASLSTTRMLAYDFDCYNNTSICPTSPPTSVPFSYSQIQAEVPTILNRTNAGASSTDASVAYFMSGGDPPTPVCYFYTSGGYKVGAVPPCIDPSTLNEPTGEPIDDACTSSGCQAAFGVQVDVSGTQATSLLPVVGIKQATEATVATAILKPTNGLTGGDFAVYYENCTTGTPLTVGEDITYHSPSWQKAFGCDDLGNFQFKGCLHDPNPDPVLVPGWITTKSGGGCNFVPVAQGEEITVPLVDCIAHNQVCTEPTTSDPSYPPDGFSPPYCNSSPAPTSTAGKDVSCAWELVTLKADQACLGNGDKCTGVVEGFSSAGSVSAGQLSSVVQLYN